MRQPSRNFREFLQDLEQTLLEAQGWTRADSVKKGYIRAALNRELYDRLVSQNEPYNYEDFVTQLRVTSDKLGVIVGRLVGQILTICQNSWCSKLLVS